jgi:hypothetical protein
MGLILMYEDKDLSAISRPAQLRHMQLGFEGIWLVGVEFYELAQVENSMWL